MASLSRCDHCEGFLPPNTTTCPHCQSACPTGFTPARAKNLAKRVAAAAGAAVMSMTLMACYGAPDEIGDSPTDDTRLGPIGDVCTEDDPTLGNGKAVNASQTAGGDITTSSCLSDNGLTRIYRYYPGGEFQNRRGMLMLKVKASSGPRHAIGLLVRKSCKEPARQLGCSRGTSQGGMLNVQMTRAEPVDVYVQSNRTSSLSLLAQFVPECDDGTYDCSEAQTAIKGFESKFDSL